MSERYSWVAEKSPDIGWFVCRDAPTDSITDAEGIVVVLEADAIRLRDLLNVLEAKVAQAEALATALRLEERMTLLSDETRKALEPSPWPTPPFTLSRAILELADALEGKLDESLVAERDALKATNTALLALLNEAQAWLTTSPNPETLWNRIEVLRTSNWEALVTHDALKSQAEALATALRDAQAYVPSSKGRMHEAIDAALRAWNEAQR